MDKRKILIIDDIEINRVLLRIIFQNDYDIIEANDGTTALEIMKKDPELSVVILDINMPIMNGFELLDIIQNDERLRLIPVIVVTETNNPENEIIALDRGAVDLINKPYDPRIVKQRVTNAIQRHELNLIQQENTLLREFKSTQLQLQTILDNLSGGICLIEIEDIFRPVYINKGFTKITGFDLASFSLLKNNMQNRIYPDDLKAYRQAIDLAISGNDSYEVTYRAISKDGQIRWQQGHFVSIAYDLPNPVILAIIYDVTELHQAEEELHDTSNKLKTLMDNIPGGVAIFKLDDKFTMTYNNEGLFTLFGYYKENRNLFQHCGEQLIHPSYYEKIYHAARIAAEKETLLEEIFCGIKCDGQVGWFLLRGRLIGLSTDNYPLFYVVILDTTKEQEQAQELRFLAEYDQLTYIYNKRAFCQETQLMIERNNQNKYALVIFDIEQFKLINELFGNKQGDDILVQIANELMRSVINGTYGRLENDHFAFCVPIDNLNIEERIEQFNYRLKSYFPTYNIILKFGIYLIDDDQVSISIMLDRANLAVKKIKGNYLLSYSFYDDYIRQQIIKNHQLVTIIPKAIENKEFRIFLQPVFDCQKNEFTSAEALVRWFDPVRGLVMPNDFIGVAEESGLITRIDYFVWEETCKTIRRWTDEGKKVIPISVNVSRVNIYKVDLVDTLVELVNKYQIDPSYLHLEITESAYIMNESFLIGIINCLKEKGFTIMMDDFGSGYSSLNMLKNMPIDILKIDRGFIGELNVSKKAVQVINSVINMAHAIGITCVAEGVETKQQLDLLCNIGCEYVQGFYFSRPLGVSDFEKKVFNEN